MMHLLALLDRPSNLGTCGPPAEPVQDAASSREKTEQFRSPMLGGTPGTRGTLTNHIAAMARACRVAEEGGSPQPYADQLERILADLRVLPPPNSDTACRLLRETTVFLGTEHWESALSLDWSLVELFGINPHAPLVHVGGQGLVTGLALSRFAGGKIIEIKEDRASIQNRSGSMLTHRRFIPAMETSLVWWECPALIGLEGGA